MTEIECDTHENKKSKIEKKKTPHKRSAGGAELGDSFIYCGAFGAAGARGPAPS